MNPKYPECRTENISVILTSAGRHSPEHAEFLCRQCGTSGWATGTAIQRVLYSDMPLQQIEQDRQHLERCLALSQI